MKLRQLFLLLAALLAISAIAVGILIGTTGGTFGYITDVHQWMMGVGLIIVGATVSAVLNHVLSGVLSLVLGWALGETGVATIKVLGYTMIAWLTALLVTAMAWAWLKHG